MRRFAAAILASLAITMVVASEPTTYKNPIIPGFHPDPSICRVGDDYYLVNSSFEWFPGVPIFHSRDLVNWKQIGNVLDRPSQLMMGDSLEHNRGIYAPTIRHHDGRFYMITTCVQAGGNFFVTADKPEGPWSDPIWIKQANGIDPSLYWDESGDCWYSGAGRLNEKRWENENAIYIAKMDTETGKFLTAKKQVSSGHANNAMYTEGPHIYKIDGKYLLLVAEGGTAEMHAISVHQSDTIDGTYTSAMINPVMTHRHLGKSHPINTIGHADLVETQSGEWWSVMLGKRTKDGHLLARETFLTPVTMERGIPIYNPGVGQVLEEDRRPNLPWSPVPSPYGRDEFDGDALGFEYACVRTPVEKWWSVGGGKLTMELKKESFSDYGNPSFWGRRIESHEFDVTTSLTLNKAKSNEEAGLLLYRTRLSYISLTKCGDKVLVRFVQKGKENREVATVAYKKSDVTLRLVAKGGKVQCYYGEDEKSLQPIGEPLALRVVGDEVNGGFNGPFVGVATSANGNESKNKAYFEWFEYNQ